LSGCATKSFQVNDVQSAAFIERGVTQTIGDVTVTAAVPDAQETLALTGLDLYEQGIQPVWLKVENNSATMIRTALWSIDPLYFSPLEVAYMNRSGYGEEAFATMERWFHENGIERKVPAGEARSGLVFTNLTPGTKGLNLDIFGGSVRRNFTFFVRMPGFVADYMMVDLPNLYGEDEFRHLDRASLDQVLESELACCATDQDGNAEGDPVNLVIVGSGPTLRRALMRASFQGTEAGSPALRAARTQHLFGRPPDGTFFLSRVDGNERVEMRLWLSPYRVGQESVWVGQVGYRIPRPDQRDDSELSFGPDIDNARTFVFQKFWYSQSVTHAGMVGGVGGASTDAPRQSFNGSSYFSDGKRMVFFLSDSPVAMDELELLYTTGTNP
jgi:hypothetical protein